MTLASVLSASWLLSAKRCLHCGPQLFNSASIFHFRSAALNTVVSLTRSSQCCRKQSSPKNDFPSICLWLHQSRKLLFELLNITARSSFQFSETEQINNPFRLFSVLNKPFRDLSWFFTWFSKGQIVIINPFYETAAISKVEKRNFVAPFAISRDIYRSIIWNEWVRPCVCKKDQGMNYLLPRFVSRHGKINIPRPKFPMILPSSTKPCEMKNPHQGVSFRLDYSPRL